MSCFPFYLLCFIFYKVGEQEGGTGSVGKRGLKSVEEGGGSEKARRMNMM
jgi:hypothetical protein